MTKNKVTLAEALTLLEKEELNGDYEIEYIDADKVASTDAIKIGALVQRRLCLRSCVCKTRFCEIGYIRLPDVGTANAEQRGRVCRIYGAFLRSTS